MVIDVGDNAPDFTLPCDGGGKVSLKSLRGKPVVLYFYPKNDTPGCTSEALAFAADHRKFAKKGIVILGVSKDSVARHDKFKSKYDLPFCLASDADSDVCQTYGVWKEKALYGRKFMGIERTTFLIDPRGIVRKIWRKVKVLGHSGEVLGAAAEL